MPYSAKEKKLMRKLIDKYGLRRAYEVYHGMLASKEHEKNFGAKSKHKH